MKKTKKINPQPSIFNLQLNKGFIALISVLIILAVALIVGLSASFLAINEAQMSLEKYNSSQSYFLANLCAEEALMKLKENENYPGNETITIEDGECQILPIEGNWTIKVVGQFRNQIKKVKIIVEQVNPEMVISSWEQVPDF